MHETAPHECGVRCAQLCFIPARNAADCANHPAQFRRLRVWTMDDRHGIRQCWRYHRFWLLRCRHTRVAQLRGSGKIVCMAPAVRSLISINFVLGFTLAAVVWIASPLLARHNAVPSLMPVGECLICMRIVSGFILMRAIESVGVSTQRLLSNTGEQCR